MKHKNKIILSSISILIVVLTLLLLSFNKHKNVLEVNNGSIAIMLETELGVYTKSQLTNWPSDDEYVFDSEKSYCLNGSNLIWNVDKLQIQSVVSDKCYAYFKSVESVSTEISTRILEFNGGKSSIEAKEVPNFEYSSIINEGMFATNDDYGMSYYFRGAVDNNWVVFGKNEENKDMYWRIVRINGDGSVKLIYNGTTIPTEAHKAVMAGYPTYIESSHYYNFARNKAEYVGYMREIDKHRGHDSDSEIKVTIDNWYEEILVPYTQYIADVIYCNDRSFTIDNWIPIGLPSASPYSDAYKRTVMQKSPQISCSHKEDAYTVDDTGRGNAKLTYPIGLITVDEVMLAGMSFGIDNLDFYLFVGTDYWTMSPGEITTSEAEVFSLRTSGRLGSGSTSGRRSIRPVISLKYDTEMIGSGKYNDPYRMLTFADTIIANNGGKEEIEEKGVPIFTSISTTNDGMYAAPDDYGITYYFRGAVPNNWVKFGKIGSDDMWWRIVRINGNGTVKLIYTGTIAPQSSEEAVIKNGTSTRAGTSAFNTSRNSAEYLGYMYTMGEHRGYSTDSTIKTNIDNWFNTNLSPFLNYLSDFIVCGDRNFTLDDWIPIGKPESAVSYYSDAYRRLTSTTKAPLLICPHVGDAFTVSDITKGNGALGQPVGLLTAEEAYIAGLTDGFYDQNHDNYLYNGKNYWTMSPSTHLSSYTVHSTNIYLVGSNGSLSGSVVYMLGHYRPVISIKGNITVSGNGLWNDPYVVEGSTIGDTGHQPDTS